MASENQPFSGSRRVRAQTQAVREESPLLERDRAVQDRSDCDSQSINLAEAPEVLDAPPGTMMRLRIYADRIVIRRLSDVLEGDDE